MHLMSYCNNLFSSILSFIILIMIAALKKINKYSINTSN